MDVQPGSPFYNKPLTPQDQKPLANLNPNAPTPPLAVTKVQSGSIPPATYLEGQNAMVQMAVSHEALTIDEQLEAMETLFHIVDSLNDFGEYEKADAALEAHPELKEVINNPSANGDTCWMQALSAGNLELMQWLEKHGADVGCVDANGRTGLMRLMLEQNHPEMMKHLLNTAQDKERGLDINAQDDAGLTAFSYALFTERLEDASLIASCGARIAEGLEIDEPVAHRVLEALQQGRECNPFDLQEFNLAIDLNITKRVFTVIALPISRETHMEAEAFIQVAPRVAQINENPDAFAKLQQARTCGSGTLTSKNNVAKRAADNWSHCDAMIREKALRNEPLRSEDICLINTLLNKSDDGGKLRTDCEITAGGALTLSYLPPSQVEQSFNQFCEILDDGIQACAAGKENPITVAAWAYQALVSIHPFSDANGRTSRLVADYILQRSGLPPMALEDNVDVAVFALDANKTISPAQAFEIVFEGVKNSYRILGIKVE